LSSVYLICGLGNPGAKYHSTRHNIGFMVIDKLAEFFKIEEFDLEDNYLYAVTDHNSDKQVVLMKPLTYMNLSGEAVKAFYEKYEIDLKNILIVYDDVNIDLGVLRMRPGGSDGGQNGIKSVMYALGTGEVPRLRIGIRAGEDYEKLKMEEGFSLANYVLSGFEEKEYMALEKVIEAAKEAVLAFVDKGLSETMNFYNRNVLKPQDES
jgi:PTH1 family peptidyl-tRNA hydrolase